MIWQNEFTLGIWIITGLILVFGAETGPEKTNLKSFNINLTIWQNVTQGPLKKWTEHLTQSNFFEIYNLGRLRDRDLSRDDWIKEFIKRKWSCGLFWAVGAAEKKKSQLPKVCNFLRCFFQFLEGKKKFKNILASALKSYIKWLQGPQ